MPPLHLARLSAPPPAPRSAVTGVSPAGARAPVSYAPDSRASRLLRLPQTYTRGYTSRRCMRAPHADVRGLHLTRQPGSRGLRVAHPKRNQRGVHEPTPRAPAPHAALLARAPRAESTQVGTSCTYASRCAYPPAAVRLHVARTRLASPRASVSHALHLAFLTARPRRQVPGSARAGYSRVGTQLYGRLHLAPPLLLLYGADDRDWSKNSCEESLVVAESLSLRTAKSTERVSGAAPKAREKELKRVEGM
ncbi:hypothetical protein FB451DRAFT_1185934 [Mycena latifolia]|nr:hypothetical protein FB451DRAFT_1185934 [Mycena latifolia]